MKGVIKGGLIFTSGLAVGLAVGWHHGAFLGYKVADAKHLQRLQESLRGVAEDLGMAQKEAEAREGISVPVMDDVASDEPISVKIDDAMDDASLHHLRPVKTTPSEDQDKLGPVEVAPDNTSGNH